MPNKNTVTLTNEQFDLLREWCEVAQENQEPETEAERFWDGILEALDNAKVG